MQTLYTNAVQPGWLRETTEGALREGGNKDERQAAARTHSAPVVLSRTPPEIISSRKTGLILDETEKNPALIQKSKPNPGRECQMKDSAALPTRNST